MQLFLSRLRRGWWDVLTSVVLAADLAMGTGAAEVVVCSSFTWATVSSVLQSSSAQRCSAFDHAALALSEQSLTVTWHPFSLPEPGILSVSSTCSLREEKLIYFANQVWGCWKDPEWGKRGFFRTVEGAWRHAQDGGRGEGIPKVIKGWGNLGFLRASFPWTSSPFPGCHQKWNFVLPPQPRNSEALKGASELGEEKTRKGHLWGGGVKLV